MKRDSSASPLQAAFLRHEDTLAPPQRALGEDDHAVYRTLLESTKAIPWKIDWATMEFVYIGPQIEALLGWAPSSWKTVHDWAERMHPDDREAVVNFCVGQSKAGTDHEADYRALTRDGGYVWLRDVVHVERNGKGEVEALIGFMFDISERKRTEEKLAQLQRELERLSFSDSLTGVGNRRHFDNVMAREWDAAKAAGKPLSLVMIDIDFFKSYNDYYGHVQGDACLQRIARVLGEAAGERHFLGRFGGEEFALILADTDAEAAMRLAERCRTLIANEAIPHVRSPHDQQVTASFGVGTVVPGDRMDVTAFINLTDAQLYHAKDNGRNRIAAVDRAGMQGEAFKAQTR
ncbi:MULTISPECIES: sensor domain-containing diguanylate cyclase [Caballeronia]|uniref:diguanylate cyclase n=1 Tax=Caballeronia cordobensis TaxID=1353886 RepID=A0A158GJU3_CABCO|nr:MULTISPECIES: sensor domain-containing diguanylate cyclase [Caballeronia]AQH03644.1 diguanylate cyclase [Burkholderia sp. KK1]BAO91195.1 diguanylate cyclase with PAS/PAC sensor [Burkholderia sp. RPE67]BBQ01407.1 sensor domain-containing diguanylate cyclase [Burkholderia sp. SFA1]MCE4546127.1 sensor domain-containing diguanylate cyclase [Caballeronia sp. PC1]MCE4573398.1 sensor domain-containing diguanylate cyclase [Caballeronia sp. CLC5]